jgi:hypothetical protein
MLEAAFLHSQRRWMAGEPDAGGAANQSGPGLTVGPRTFREMDSFLLFTARANLATLDSCMLVASSSMSSGMTILTALQTPRNALRPVVF